MDKILTCIFVGIFLVVVVCSFIITTAYPNTYLATYKVSGKTRSEITKQLQKWTTSPIKIQVKDRIYEYRYSDLGINLDIKATVDSLFEGNSLPFPKNIVAYFNSYSTPSMKLPVVALDQNFYNFTQNIVYDFGNQSDAIVVNNTDKKLDVDSKDERYKYDPQSLRDEILSNVSQQKPGILKPYMVKANSEKQLTVEEYNKHLQAAFDKPVNVIIKDSKEISKFDISPTMLRNLVVLNFQQDTNQLSVNIDDWQFRHLFKPFMMSIDQKEDKKLAPEVIKKDIITLLNARATGNAADTLTINTDIAPNTIGDKAPKYIEVDISQQRMYLFDKGELVNSYRVSTGLDYPTPVGEFKIMNKAVNAWSNIYDVWMPYWMAFNYAKDVNAYLGIHETPYKLAENGQIHRPSNFIGQPNTGGCVALDVGQSKIVYDFADIGTPVIIFQ